MTLRRSGYQLAETIAPATRAKIEQGWAAPKCCNESLPKLPRPSYHDPSKARAIDQVLADLRKRIASNLQREGGADRVARVIGRAAFPGYVTTDTDGFIALARKGEAYGPTAGATPWQGPVVPYPLATLTPEVWTWYAPVRPFLHDRSHAMTWTFTEANGGRLKLSAAGNPYDLGEGTSVIPLPVGGDATLILNDQYLWAMRGVAWTVAVKGQVGIFTDGDQMIIVAGWENKR